MKTTEKTISLNTLIADYATYNLWANTQLVEWLRSKPVELMTEEVPSSFSSLQATLLHIWDVERSWLGHLKQAPVPSFRLSGFDGTLDEILEGILRDSAAVMEHVNALSYNELISGCFFSIPYVGDQTVPAFEIVQHTLNHSTYHRGQLVTIGRNVGITDAPMTDFMFYVLRVKPNVNKVKALAA